MAMAASRHGALFAIGLALAALAPAACGGDDDLFPGGTGGGSTGGGGSGGEEDRCPPGFADCDGDDINGCELEILSDLVNCGGCGATCLDGGTCTDGVCSGVAQLGAEPGSALQYLVIEGSNLYWTSDDGAGTGALSTMPKTGGEPRALAAMQPGPFRLATNDDHVYWVDINDPAVLRMPLEGGTPEVFAAGQATAWGVAIAGDAVLWTLQNTSDPAQSGVVVLPIAGGEPALIATPQSPDTPYDIAVDALAVYWVDRGSGEVLKAPIGGGEVQVLVNGQDEPFNLALDQGNVYWTNHACMEGQSCVMRISKDGSGGVTAIAGMQSVPYDIATDGEHVYWTDVGFGTVMRAPVDGGEAVALAMDQPTPIGVALDGEFVYWTNEDGSIRKIAK